MLMEFGYETYVSGSRSEMGRRFIDKNILQLEALASS
jgi:hypothetical protein